MSKSGSSSVESEKPNLPGTGSCASAVAAIAAKRAQSPVRVHAPGGVQTVRWEDQVFLRGSGANSICRGEFFV